MMGTVIPLRPFENALEQARKLNQAPSRSACIAAVHHELRQGRNGQAVAFQLQRARHHGLPAQGGAA